MVQTVLVLDTFLPYQLKYYFFLKDIGRILKVPFLPPRGAKRETLLYNFHTKRLSATRFTYGITPHGGVSTTFCYITSWVNYNSQFWVSFNIIKAISRNECLFSFNPI